MKLLRAVFISLLLLPTSWPSFAVVTAPKPNIILVLLDDLGWRDTGFMGNTVVETPNLDKLAHDGLVFTNAYANAPNCAPSRAAIMSGQYAPRTQVYTMMTGDMGDTHIRRVLTPPNKVYLEPGVITVAEMLKSAGYRTASIGKWNLGSGDVRGPTGQGFDINIAGHRGGDAHDGYFAPYDYLPGLEHAPAGEYLTDRLSDEAVKFIKRADQRPFFLYLAHFAPHYPYQAPQALVKKYRDKQLQQHTAFDPVYAAMIDTVDQGIGRILATLAETHQLDNTLIIFTSDNGGVPRLSDLGGLRGGKSLLYEGGIRVPMFFWWPGHINRGNSAEPVMGIDLYPTLMKLAGVSSVAQPLDGADLSPLFRQPAIPLARDALFWYFPAYVADDMTQSVDNLFTQRPALVIRQGNWKLIRYLDSDRTELYNLAQDPDEHMDLSQQETGKRMELAQRLQEWAGTMQAPLPLSPNPDYDPGYEQQPAWLRKLRSSWQHLF